MPGSGHPQCQHGADHSGRERATSVPLPVGRCVGEWCWVWVERTSLHPCIRVGDSEWTRRPPPSTCLLSTCLDRRLRTQRPSSRNTRAGRGRGARGACGGRTLHRGGVGDVCTRVCPRGPGGGGLPGPCLRAAPTRPLAPSLLHTWALGLQPDWLVCCAHGENSRNSNFITGSASRCFACVTTEWPRQTPWARLLAGALSDW